ncbi:MAG: hypothetical protein WDA16_12935 [Candidatus Thermoplasmatota archaeon]
MDAEVKRWGNSFAVRLSKKELERLGIHEGDRVDVSLKKAPKRKKGKISLEGLPVFHDTATDGSENHDEYLYGWRRGDP